MDYKIGDNVQGISLHGVEVEGVIEQLGKVFPVAIVKVNEGDRLDIHECYNDDLKLL